MYLHLFSAQKALNPQQMIQIEHNILKYPNRKEATNQLAFFISVPKKTNSGATLKQIQVVVRAALESRTAGL